MIKTIFCALFFCFVSYGFQMSNLISDKDFTNQNFSIKDVIQFVRVNFPKCKLSDDELTYVANCGYYRKINALVILCKLQQEQSLIEDCNVNTFNKRKTMAMGCRLYSFYTKKPREKYWGFKQQVFFGTEILRYNFDDFEYGNEILLEDGNYNRQTKRVWPENSSTWALYVYCPSYGEVKGHPWMAGKTFTGNKTFAEKFMTYKRMWIKQYGSF